MNLPLKERRVTALAAKTNLQVIVKILSVTAPGSLGEEEGAIVSLLRTCSNLKRCRRRSREEQLTEERKE